MTTWRYEISPLVLENTSLSCAQWNIFNHSRSHSESYGISLLCLLVKTFSTLWQEFFLSLSSHVTSSIYHIETLFSLLFCPTKLTACQVNPYPWPVITGLQKKNYLQVWRRDKKTYLKSLLHTISYLRSVVWTQHVLTGELKYSQFIGYNIL